MATIFISCGQATKAERSAAEAVRKALVGLGFNVYVAIQAQSIEDVNAGIIGQLKRADYFIFIDFKRESFGWFKGARGSLFTNQELAIAYLLDFEHVLFFQEMGIRLEGLLQYMGSNATRFANATELPRLITDAVGKSGRNWSPDYSRHLIPLLRWTASFVTYGNLSGYFLQVDLENRRTDLAAFDTVARLETINGVACDDRSLLKATGYPGYTQIVWPASHSGFDLFVVDHANHANILLNSALDLSPKPPIISGHGVYRLQYAVMAREYPTLYFGLELTVDGSPKPPVRLL
jgi:hypothetical protein